jgi:hypothetical protein
MNSNMIWCVGWPWGGAVPIENWPEAILGLATRPGAECENRKNAITPLILICFFPRFL